MCLKVATERSTTTICLPKKYYGGASGKDLAAAHFIYIIIHINISIDDIKAKDK